MIKYFKILFICLLFLACTKEEIITKTTVINSSITDTIPQIEFISISTNTIKEYSNELTLTINYKDGDGNLGENNPDIKNLFVTDSRNNVEYKYRIPQLAPNATIAIKGNLKIKLNTVATISSAISETLTYSIYVKDRNGNKSNVITSSAITVTK